MSTVLDRRASVIAGVGLLVMSVLGGFGNFGAVEALVTPGAASRTAADIAASATLFRLGIASLLAVVVLDILVVWRCTASSASSTRTPPDSRPRSA